MAKVKLELQSKDDPTLLDFAQTHIADMVGNVNYPTPSPTAAVFDPLVADFDAKLLASDQAQATARAATVLKDASRAALFGGLTNRGEFVQQDSGGEEAKILSAGFQVRAVPTPIGGLPAPEDFMPTMGDIPGQIDLSWNAVRGAKSYVYELREQGTVGPWTQDFSTKSRAEAHGLVSGKTYAFRVLAIGAAGKGPWSLEAARMAP